MLVLALVGLLLLFVLLVVLLFNTPNTFFGGWMAWQTIDALCCVGRGICCVLIALLGGSND